MYFIVEFMSIGIQWYPPPIDFSDWINNFRFFKINDNNDLLIGFMMLLKKNKHCIVGVWNKNILGIFSFISKLNRTMEIRTSLEITQLEELLKLEIIEFKSLIEENSEQWSDRKSVV